jgi:twitching motility protein PilJ
MITDFLGDKQMESGQDFNELYDRACDAYRQGKYEEAAAITDELERDYPHNPHICLLQANIHYMFDDFATALNKYERVLTLTEDDPQAGELIQCAREGIERTQGGSQTAMGEASSGSDSNRNGSVYSTAGDGSEDNAAIDFADWSPSDNGFNGDAVEEMDSMDWDSAIFSGGDSSLLKDGESGEPTVAQLDPPAANGETALNIGANPFLDPETPTEDILAQEVASAWPGDRKETDAFSFSESDSREVAEMDEVTHMALSNTPSEDLATAWPGGRDVTEPLSLSESDSREFSEMDEVTHMALSGASSPFTETVNQLDGDVLGGDEDLWQSDIFQDEPITQLTASSRSLSSDNSDVLDGFESTGETELTDRPAVEDSDFFSDSFDSDSRSLKSAAGDLSKLTGGGKTFGGNRSTVKAIGIVPPKVDMKHGRFAKFHNASFDRKKWYLSAGAGIASALAVLIVGGISALTGTAPAPTATPSPAKVSTPQKNGKASIPKKDSKAPVSKKDPKAPPAKTEGKSSQPASKNSPLLLLALAGGLSGFCATFGLSHLAFGLTQRSIRDLMNQFEAIRNGNFNARATVYSADEMGVLVSDFNDLSLKILNQMQNALQRAEDMEQARDDLQRQVIRLLDDVEGAARGDLTVEAEVTADVLGTVADAFNLTIKNLREIVSQVKQAAKQVNKGSTDSELFARNNSSDALRMAEELAVTLNSVQMLTESVQRVADNAREAEEVAHTSSVTALKGGEAVERTVAGVLQIRETVSETARKVKRLAEASQEISKIVALISQIASRTNLLALNASIQAARAGESGRGFAIVADEVRQLADRSAKSLKEIEQIVLQIQSETGSVMTAMEEGIQQVIDVTDKSEQAKRSLEDIIEVSNRINNLVRSITSDTIKQRENSHAVAQVMQSVESIAQETSQESQRVAGSLQNLVSISRDLLSSVEKFRVDSTES